MSPGLGDQAFHRVLVVDDDLDILDILKTLIGGEGFEVITASTGAEFFSILADEKPSLALVDFMLPGLNGMDIVKMSRRIDEHLPIVVITGQGNEKLAAEFIRQGAFDYLTKPFESDEVLKAVRKAIDIRRSKESDPYRELARVNEDLERSGLERAAIVDCMADGLITTDPELRVLSWNSSAELITGMPLREVLGRPMVDVFAEDFCRGPRELLCKNEGDGKREREVEIPREGSPRSILQSVSLLKGESGNPSGVVISLKEVTELKLLHREKLERERELIRVQEKLRYQENLARQSEILEQKVAELDHKVSEISALYDVNRIITSKLDLKEVLKTVIAMAGRLFKAQACSIRLLDSQEELLELAAHDGLSEVYLDHQPLALGESIAGAAVKQQKPIQVSDVMGDRRFRRPRSAREEGLKSLFCLPLIIRGRSLGVMTLYHREPYDYDENEVTFLETFAGSVSIAIENARLYSEKCLLAVTDGLTGLNNHRFFHETLASEVSRSKRYGSRFSLIMIDIDYFKLYNDAHGHQAGDDLLRALSSLLNELVRENDFVARYGGEEFAVLLYGAGKEEATQFAERLCERVSQEDFAGEELLPGGRLTVSIGVSACPKDATVADDLVLFSDRALYRAKHEGRNCVRVHK